MFKMNTSVRGYNVGEIHATAAFTSEFALVGIPPLDMVVNMQDAERQVMNTRGNVNLCSRRKSKNVMKYMRLPTKGRYCHKEKCKYSSKSNCCRLQPT